MQISVSLPTYGQIAAELQRSSPGLQTRHKLANYLIKSELEKSDQCASVTMLNKALLLSCNGTDPAQLTAQIHSLVKKTYSEVFEINLDAFLAEIFLDA